MIKLILFSSEALLLFITLAHCQSWNDTDLIENVTEIIPPKPFVYYGRYHHLRVRRQYSYNDTTSNLSVVETILSILPLDRLGALIGQLMATSIKEIFNPNVGKKVVNIIENQAPSLLTSLFTNIYSTFRGPVRSSTSNMTTLINRNINQQVSNDTKSIIINSLRRPETK